MAMADEKIEALDPLIIQSSTDLYETSANGDGSFKETRAQMLSYINENFLSANNTFTGNNIFTGPVMQPCTEISYNSTATLSAANLVQKMIVSNPGVPITLTLPLGSDFETELGSPINNTALENITFINFNITNAVTLVGNTGFTLGGVVPSVDTIPPQSSKSYKAKRQSSNTYILYSMN